MLKQPLRSPRPRPGEAKRGQVPCRARPHGDLQSDFVVARVRSMPLPPGALACHLAINCGLGLLLRNAGGDLGFLRIETAKADRAIGPCRPSRNVSQFTCAIATPSGLAATSAAPPRNKKPNCHVRFKSQPPCSVIRRGLARRVGSTEPAARRTTRRQPRSHRPDVRP